MTEQTPDETPSQWNIGWIVAPLTVAATGSALYFHLNKKDDSDERYQRFYQV